MAKISLTPWKDPVKRPRFFIWTGVAALVFIAVMIVTLGVTSTRWFCAVGCHKVQDDTITAYNRSSHSQISCMACHMPVNADPATFMLHKMEALGELYLTVTNKFELPLNAESEVAKEMHVENCTQCHSKNRTVSPMPGIIIDHEVHAKNEVKCTMCHNRIAHIENFELELKHPVSGEENHKHEDWMKMEACFRCHGLEKGAKAPGKCSACHPSDFKLTPDSHLDAGWFPKGHAEAKKEDPKLCRICHDEKIFCTNCHGMEMPHSQAFKEKEHPKVAETLSAKCVQCHDPKKTEFCNGCHHGERSNWEYDKKVPWQLQHAAAVRDGGIDACLKCHEKAYCTTCHTKLKPVPTSHKSRTWVYLDGEENLAPHAASAKKAIVACEICHGAGGTKTKFCLGCHKIEIPHTDVFKQFHSKTGKKAPAVCLNCHRYRELCSNCHHQGASKTKPWQIVHSGVVAKNGATGCLEKCHQKNECVTCHTRSKVIPGSHKTRTWTRRANLQTPARHNALFKSNPDSCTFCHGDGGTSSKFCSACHKLPIPHVTDYANQHKDGFRAKKLTKAMCSNCHVQLFCDSCHHKGSVANQLWLLRHAAVVKKDGTTECFKCHKETYCSYCHVRADAVLRSRGLKR